MRHLAPFAALLSGLILSGCTVLPAPDGAEAKLLAAAEGRPALSTSGRIGQAEVAAAGLMQSPGVRAAASAVAASADEVRIQRASLFPSLGLEIGGGAGKAGKGDAALELAGSQLLSDFGNTERKITVADLDLQINYLNFLKKVDESLRESLAAADQVDLHHRRAGIHAAQLAAMKKIGALVDGRAEAARVEAQKRIQAAELLAYESRLALGEAEDRLMRLSGLSQGMAVAVAATGCASRGATLDLHAAHLRQARARIQRDAAERARHPRITLNPVAKTDAETGVKFGVNFGVNSDLLQGGGLSAKADAAEAALHGADAAVEQARLDDMLTERRLTRETNAGAPKIAMLERQIALLDKTRDIYRKEYLARGARPLSDLLDNEEDYHARLIEREELRAALALVQVDCALRGQSLRRQLQLDSVTLHGLPLSPGS